MNVSDDMQSALEMHERLRRALVAIEALPPLGGGKRAEQLRRTLLAAAKQTFDSYRDASVSRSPDQFIERISVVARKAKRTTAVLVLLVHLDYIEMAHVRDLIVEVRALERLLRAARNTARRRQRERLVRSNGWD